MPFLFLGDLPNPGIEPVPLALAVRLFTTEPLAKPYIYNRIGLKNKSPNSVNRHVDKQGIFGRMALKHVKYHV